MLKFTVFLSLFFGSVSCLRWPDHLQDPSRPVEVCAGDNIRLLWNFTLEAGERVKEMVWTCQTDGQEAEHVVATYLSDNFVPASQFSGRLLHLQGGGVEMSCATKLESGNYSVTVTTEDSHNQQTVYSKRAVVTVLDAPKTYKGILEVTEEAEPVYDESSGQWHVQLTCGNFSDKGHPHVDVIWRTPEGQELHSSSEDNETYHLLVPNPPSGGNYSCSLPPLFPAARCLPPHSPMLESAAVDVDQVKVTYSLLGARQEQLAMELANEVAQLRAENKQLMGDLSAVNASFSERLHSVVEESRKEARSEAASLVSEMNAGKKRVSFHGRLQDTLQYFTGRLHTFTRDVLNEGQAFDPSTGVFTAPFNGTYYFIGTAGTSEHDKYVSMYLTKDGTYLTRALARQYSEYYTMGSCSILLHLTVGERVWLHNDHRNSYYYYQSTTFTGFLITADE